MVAWKNYRIAEAPLKISACSAARKVRLFDSRLDLSRFWVTPDAGKLGDFVWDSSVRRELKSKPGWLSKALRPFVHKGKKRADGENRLDLVLDLKPGVCVCLQDPSSNHSKYFNFESQMHQN